MLKFYIIAGLSLSTMIMTGCTMLKGSQNSGRAQNTARSDSAGIITQNNPSISPEMLGQYTSGWPETSQKAARLMLEKYGQPTESTSSHLIWGNVPPFKRIIVHRLEVSHRFPLLHKDILEHVVDYKVPLDKVEDLIRFNGSLNVDRTRGELAARCENEAMNLIALNLASEIINDKRTSEDARIEMGRLVVDYMNGNRTGHSEGLQFGRQLRTADADVSSKINWARQAQEDKIQKQETIKQAQEEEMTE